MRRSLRFLIVLAPLIVLLLGVPAGVALARRTPPSAPITISPGAIGTAIANGTPLPNVNGPFVGPRRLFGPPLPVSQAQIGINGTITNVRSDRIIVYTKMKRIAFVVIDPKTLIRFQGKNIKVSDLARGDTVTILGHRDREGAFHAELVRVTRPPPPDPLPGGAR